MSAHREKVAQPGRQPGEQTVWLPKAVGEDPNLTPTDFRLLFTIAGHDWESNANGCTLSQSTLARKTNSSEKTVQRGLKKLEAIGYIFPPEPQFHSITKDRIGTIIRLTSRLRPGRKVAAAVQESSISQLELTAGGQVTVTPPVTVTTPRPDESTKKTRRLSGGPVTVTPPPEQTIGEPPHEGGSEYLTTPSGRSDRTGSSHDATPGSGHRDPLNKHTEPKPSCKQEQQQGAGAARGFQKKVRGHVIRQSLLPEDVDRLRQLDAWECEDSPDYLSMLLGVLFEREARAGRVATPSRLRALYDGAANSRQLRKPGIQSVPGALLVGIEKGYLLARPRPTHTSIADLAPGARDAIEGYARRVKNGGAPVSAQTLADFGIQQKEFNALVEAMDDEGSAESREGYTLASMSAGVLKKMPNNEAATVVAKPQEVEAPSPKADDRNAYSETAQEWDIRERLEKTLPSHAFMAWVKSAQLLLNDHELTVRCRSHLERKMFEELAVPLLTEWGFTVTVDAK